MHYISQKNSSANQLLDRGLQTLATQHAHPTAPAVLWEQVAGARPLRPVGARVAAFCRTKYRSNDIYVQQIALQTTEAFQAASDPRN